VAQTEHLFLLCDKECTRLVFVARLPERGTRLLDGVRRGKEFPPVRRLHSVADCRMLELFDRELALFQYHLDTTGEAIQEFCSYLVALQPVKPPDDEVLSECREQRIDDDGDELSPGSRWSDAERKQVASSSGEASNFPS
jgi:hypothetical protein